MTYKYFWVMNKRSKQHTILRWNEVEKVYQRFHTCDAINETQFATYYITIAEIKIPLPGELDHG